MDQRDAEEYVEEFNFGRRPQEIVPARIIIQPNLPEEKPKKGKKKRPYKAPPLGMRYIIEWDEEYRIPIGPEGEMLDRKLRDMSRHNDLFPLDRPWLQQTEISLSDSWDVLVYEFDLTKTTTAIAYWYMQRRLGKKWRNYKNEVKKKYFLRHVNKMDMRTMVALLPSHINSNQFTNLYAQWTSDRAKEIAAKNSANRRMKVMNHRSGPRSFNKIRQDLRKEGIEPTRTATMTRAFGTSNPQIQRLLEVCNSNETRNLSLIMSLSEVEQHNIDQVMGPNKKKRKLGIGEGAFLPNSSSSGRFIRQHSVKEKDKQPVGVFVPQDQLDEMMRRMREMESELRNLKENMGSSSSNLP